MKICSECGEKLNDSSNFCPKCGTEYKAKICSGCGEELDDSSNFCPKCGKKYEEVIVNDSVPMKILQGIVELVMVAFALDD